MASNSKKRRRVLGASCILAALIIASSSFAWFTSKDEVTNRLSASAEYGVAIAENFQPPEKWVPGQEINKDAAATNTGNVDAFVRMRLDGSMRLLKQNTTGSTTQIAGYSTANKNFGTAPTTETTDESLINAGLVLTDGSGNYFKTLSTTQAENPALTLSTSHGGFTGTTSANTSKALSEVQAMQSGILAYAPTNAEYTYILNEPTTLTIKVETVDGSAPAIQYQTVEVPAGTVVHVGGTAGTGVAYTSGAMTIPSATYTDIMGNTGPSTPTVYVQTQTHDDSSTFFAPVDVEYETFVPLTDGLYLFLRNESNADQANPEFSGYYRNTQTTTNAQTNTTSSPAAPIYYALNTDTNRANDSNYTVAGVKTTATYAKPIAVTYDSGDKNILHVLPSANLELFTAQYTAIDTEKLKFYADATDTATKTKSVYAVYDEDKDTTFDKNEDIIVEIKLANIGTDAEGWTVMGETDAATAYTVVSGTTTYAKDATKLTFYYNNDLESGDTSAKLVDQVKLYDGVTNKAYLAFDFDLNVNLESIQVTYNEDGTESDRAVNPKWDVESASNWTAAKGVGTVASGSKEISSITWTAN